jgi:hypothetical protein
MACLKSYSSVLIGNECHGTVWWWNNLKYTVFDFNLQYSTRTRTVHRFPAIHLGKLDEMTNAQVHCNSANTSTSDVNRQKIQSNQNPIIRATSICTTITTTYYLLAHFQ